MIWGMGLVWLIVIVVLIVAIAALVKYVIPSGSKGRLTVYFRGQVIVKTYTIVIQTVAFGLTV
jgi:hypothetical protein